MCNWNDAGTFLFLMERFGLCGFTWLHLYTAFTALKLEVWDRCLSRIMREDRHLDQLVGGEWPIDQSQRLAHEVLGVLQRTLSLGISRIGWIEEGRGPLGLCLRNRWDQIFVTVGGICHPYQVVITVIHEVAHQLVYRSGHVGDCNNPHCGFFDRCYRYAAAGFVVSCHMIYHSIT